MDAFGVRFAVNNPQRFETLRSLYPSEIKRVSMLGAAGDLHWVQTPDGLMITPPAEKPCEHAFVFKIERQHPFAG